MNRNLIFSASMFLLCSCAQADSQHAEKPQGAKSPVATTKNAASVTEEANFDWLTPDAETKQLPARRGFPKVISDFLTDEATTYTQELYVSWRGIGYAWNNEIPKDYSSRTWSEAALTRLSVGNDVSAEADAATIERPWLIELHGDSKWVDAVIFSPLGSCYRAAGKPCNFFQDEEGEGQFNFVKTLQVAGTKLEARIDCPTDVLFREISVYHLTVPGKKKAIIWDFSEAQGVSGGMRQEFGILFDTVNSSGVPCDDIASYYE